MAALVAFGGLAWVLQRNVAPTRIDPENPPMHVFPGVTGPEGVTWPAPAKPAEWAEYSKGEASRLAILLTQEDSSWLGLAHALRSFGVPFRVTRNVEDALRHRAVVVYPTISGRVLAAEELRRLARHPESGGTLIGFGIEGGGLNEVFGFARAEASDAHRTLRLREAAEVAEFTDPAERDLPVNSPVAGSKVAMLSYVPTTAEVLAEYDDGGAGVLHRRIGGGHAYAFGFDLGHLSLKGFNDRQEEIARSYANEYGPVIDVWWRLVRRIYRDAEPAAVTVHPVPGGRPLAVVLSHDVDYTRSLENARAYAALEREQGVAATYFVQTKYVRDWNDDIFMNEAAGPILRELRAAGAEIASHSVSHSRVFETFPVGSGSEAYPDYRPFVTGKESAVNGSVLGELRVSKFLLEHFTAGGEVRSFRPGHLRNPFALPESLEATGYRFVSAAAANCALTHLPFRLTHGRGTTAPVGVYEFPVTIEDELPPALPERLDAALGVAERIARYGGLFMVLIHTDTADAKLEFQRKLTVELKQRGAWFGRLGDLGDWWVARDQLEIETRREGRELVLGVTAGAACANVAFDLPAGRWELVQGSGNVMGGARLVVDVPAGTSRWRLRQMP